jgi:hypothetical protein
MVIGERARFFVDESDLALGRCLALARRDVVHPGHPQLPEIPYATLDQDWLPIVGRLGLPVITRDKRIRSRPVEARDLSTWDTLTILVRQWHAIETFIDGHPTGPWLAAVTNQGVKPLRVTTRS